MEDHADIHWSNQLEDLIAGEAEKCRGLAWIHQRCEMRYSYLNNYIAIPVIVLSTLSGATSMSSSALFGSETKASSIAIGLVSIGCGILNTIQSYFGYSRKAEAHRIAFLNYSKLFSNIAVELSLPREERLQPEQVLKTLRDNMERLAETTPSPPPDILEAFNRQFKDYDKSIARPIETNGLHKISIYRVDNPLYTPKKTIPSIDVVSKEELTIRVPQDREQEHSGSLRSRDVSGVQEQTHQRGEEQRTQNDEGGV